MVLLISAQGGDITSPVDSRFGRAQWLVKVDTDTNQCEGFVNPAANQRGGAGVAAAQFAVDQKAGVVVSGDFGPNASGALRAAGITMKLFDHGVSSVQDAVDFYKQDKLIAFG